MTKQATLTYSYPTYAMDMLQNKIYTRCLVLTVDVDYGFIGDTTLKMISYLKALDPEPSGLAYTLHCLRA